MWRKKEDTSSDSKGKKVFVGLSGGVDSAVFAALHDPITDSDDNPSVLRVLRHGDGLWVHADWGKPDNHWIDYGAFVFLVSAS